MMKWIASAAFGMEGMTSRDLKRLGMQNVKVMDIGGAMFEGSFEDAFRANLWLRTCDRVLLVMDRFEARSFEELGVIACVIALRAALTFLLHWEVKEEHEEDESGHNANDIAVVQPKKAK